MLTFTISIRRSTVRVLAILLLIYIASYGACRATGLLVHAAQNRYTAGSAHDVWQPGHASPTAPLAVIFFPLRLVESAAWPVIDAVVGSSIVQLTA